MDIQKIYIENRQMVFNHVLSIVKDYHNSEEVTNNVFIKMFRLPCAEYDKKHGAALNTWLIKIAYQQSIDYIRTNHQDRYKAVSEFVDESGKQFFSFESPKSSQADNDILSGETKTKINAAIENLDVKYRRVAILYFLWEYEYIEIADILNMPMGTVKGMLNRCRAKLQTSLKGSRMTENA